MSVDGKRAGSLDASPRNDSSVARLVKAARAAHTAWLRDEVEGAHCGDLGSSDPSPIEREMQELWTALDAVRSFDAKPCGDQGPFNEGCQREAGHEGDHTHWHPTSGGSGSWAQRREAASTDVDDAKHLLRAARAILGCEDPDTSLVPDAECLRQLAINFRGALSRLVEAAESGAGVALRVKEARGVLAGEQYDPAEDVSVSSNDASLVIDWKAKYDAAMSAGFGVAGWRHRDCADCNGQWSRRAESIVHEPDCGYLEDLLAFYKAIGRDDCVKHVTENDVLPEGACPWCHVNGDFVNCPKHSGVSSSKATPEWTPEQVLEMARMVDEQLSKLSVDEAVMCGFRTRETEAFRNGWIAAMRHVQQHGQIRPADGAESDTGAPPSAGRLLGEVICAGTLSRGERLANPTDHAAVHAIVDMVEQRDAALDARDCARAARDRCRKAWKRLDKYKASTRKGCAGDPEWDALIRIAKAASAVHRYVTKNGGFKGGVLENHGHNRTGTGCLECQILNEVQESLRAWGDLPETPQGGDEMRAPGESPDLVGRASGMAGSSSSDEHHEGGVDRAEGPVGERLPSGTLSTQGATPPGQVRRPDVPPEVTRDCDGADLKVGDIVQHLEGDEDYRIDSFDPPVPRTRFARVTWLHPTKGEVPQRGPVPLTNIRKRRERASTGKDGGK